MNVAPLIHRSRFGLKELAATAGIPHGTVKHLSAANREAGEAHRRRLAAAFRKQAARLVADAEMLESAR